MESFDLVSTSALTSLHERPYVVSKSGVGQALAELDAGLGLGKYSKSSAPMLPTTRTACECIDIELEAIREAMRKDYSSNPLVGSVQVSDDTTSCVSGSGIQGHGTVVKTEDSSDAIDVLFELQALDSRANTTAMSPPLVKSLVKRNRFR